MGRVNLGSCRARLLGADSCASKKGASPRESRPVGATTSAAGASEGNRLVCRSGEVRDKVSVVQAGRENDIILHDLP